MSEPEPAAKLGEAAESSGLEALSSGALQAEIVDLAARIAAATCRWLTLVAEFDRRGAYEDAGFGECSTWLAWRCSIAPRSAREHVRVARALAELPHICQAMANGDLTYSKVRVLTRIATPELDEDLVELARQATAAQLERIARAYGRILNTEDADRIHERRYLAYEWESDGSLSVRGNLPAEDGAVLLRGLEAARESIRADVERRGAEPEQGGSAEPRIDRREPVNADALVLLAESLLTGGARERAAADRVQVVIHVDETALAGEEEGPRRCELEDGVPIAPETARRLACDAYRVVMVDGADGAHRAGRRTRTIPASVRRTVSARDGGCRFPGCTHRRWVDNHHVKHWSQGGETTPENLVQLCRRHHRLVHEGGFSLERVGADEFIFRNPHGLILESSPPLKSGRRDAPHSGRRRMGALERTAGNPIPLAGGERMDLYWTLAVLGSRHQTARGP